MTMNRTWAYNPADQAWKPAWQLIRNLVEVVSRRGNYLLNVGPTSRGTLPPEAEERLCAIGAWMRANGEAVHGTTYGPLQDLRFGRTTAKAGIVYLHVFDWPGDGHFLLPRFPGSVSAVSLLATQEPLAFSQRGGDLHIQGPPQAPDPVVTVLAMRTGQSGAPPA
jgi:alpha-L-fucosidase